LFSNLSRNEVPLVEDPVVGLVSFTSLSMNELFKFFLDIFLLSLSWFKFTVLLELAYNLSTFGIFWSLRSYNPLLLLTLLSGLTLRLNLDNSLVDLGLSSLFFFGLVSLDIFSLNNWHSIEGIILLGYKTSKDAIILSTIGQSTGKKSLQIS